MLPERKVILLPKRKAADKFNTNSCKEQYISVLPPQLHKEVLRCFCF
jgi:hypothetical protein